MADRAGQKKQGAVERAFRNPFSAVNKESTGIIPNSNKDASSQNKSKGNFQSVTAIEMQMMREITEDIAKMLPQSQELEQSIQIELTPDGVRINIFDHSQKPVFEPGTDQFTDYGNWVFSTLAWEIARFDAFRIELEGTPRREPVASGEWRDGSNPVTCQPSPVTGQLGFVHRTRQRRPAQTHRQRRHLRTGLQSFRLRGHPADAGSGPESRSQPPRHRFVESGRLGCRKPESRIRNPEP